MQLEDKKIHKIMLSVLITDDFKEVLCEIQTFGSSCLNSSNEEVTLCPKNCNVIRKDHESLIRLVKSP